MKKVRKFSNKNEKGREKNDCSQKRVFFAADAIGQREQMIILLLINFLSLIFFINKPVHVDDSLFLWASEHILKNPIDFYGFDVNWYGSSLPMWEVMQNPPLLSYVLAIPGLIFGFNEAALHTAVYIVVLFSSLGLYKLARLFCESPMLAALISSLTPVFMICGTTLMCDVLLLCLWIWSVYFWIEGITNRKYRPLLLSAALMSASALTKYSGICLVPLLLAYTIFSERKVTFRPTFLFIPVLCMMFYDIGTYALYGKCLFTGSFGYATAHSTLVAARLEKLVYGLSFLGGCIPALLFLAPILLFKREIVAFAAIALAALGIMLLFEGENRFQIFEARPNYTMYSIQVGLFISIGVMTFYLACADMVKNRRAESFLLFLWILGIFVFACQINWSVNGRSILPALPAVGIVLARRAELPGPLNIQWRRYVLWAGLTMLAVFSLAVTRGDYLWASSARDATRKISAEVKKKGNDVFFQGHWGFQYYMQKENFTALDWNKPKIKPGDLLVCPTNNTNVEKPFFRVGLVTKWREELRTGVSIMDLSHGAGFYSDMAGPAPFILGSDQEEGYLVLKYLP